MRPGLIFFFAALSGAFLLGACTPETREVEIEGQIFISSGEGESVPLSLVRVQVFDRTVLADFLKTRQREFETRKEGLERDMIEAEEALANARTAREEAVEALRDRQAAIREERSRNLEEVAATIRNIEEQIQGNERLLHGMRERPSPPAGIPARKEYEEFLVRRQLWDSMNEEEREIWREAIAERNEEARGMIEQERRNQESRLEIWEEELAGMEAAVGRAEARIREAEADLDRHRGRSEGFPQTGDYFSDLPEPMDQVMTDANGDFHFFLESDRRAALVARVDREIRGRSEHHLWLLWVDPKKDERRRLLLSDHNSLSADSTDKPLPVGPAS